MNKTANFALRSDVKKRWLKALRSKHYPQGRFMLYSKNDGGFCCLGVLCKVLGTPKRKMSGIGLPNPYIMPGAAFEMFTQTALGANSYKVMFDGSMVSLPHLNDRKQLSFEAIAEIIERTVPTFYEDPKVLTWPTN